MKRKSKKKRDHSEEPAAELSTAPKLQKQLSAESEKASESLEILEESLPTRAKDVSLIERAIDRRIIPLVEGPVGCGKTALLRQIAFKHGKKETFCIIQMGEQVDSKGLFGTYHCTEIPGEFVWRPSVLANAVAEGHWVLLEDINSAPAEVLGALMPLIELRRINLPGRGTIVAHDQFRLFVTVRTNRTGQRLGSAEKAVFLDKFWLRIRLQSFTDRELRRVISCGHPRLAVVSKRLVQTFAHVVQTSAQFDRPTRLLSTRDLLKWCNRLASRCELDDSTGVFQEAVDVMAAFAPTVAMRRTLMESIASLLSVSPEQVDFYATKHRPTVKISEPIAVFGRVSLQRIIGNTQMFSNDCFALTRPVCQLLERLAICVHMNEAILLTGETGCGKTAAVQFIAKHTGRKLHVVNMSQQSESSDLLGGHKPVSMQTIMDPIRRSYVQLFEQCFSKDKNAKFLHHIQKSFVDGRWAELIQLMLHTARKASIGQSPKADEWRRLIVQLRRYERVVAHPDALPFAFVQGVLLQAAIRGEWILLDEINLASAETLNCLCTLLDGDERVFLQNEGGEELRLHADFRLIACMNPATDVGKRDLPVGVRNRFTEIFVDEVDCQEDLLVLAQSYLQGLTLAASTLSNLVELYLALRTRSSTLTSDAWGHHPNYSLRTFCRALSYASENPYGNELRSLYEAFCMSFLTEVDDKSRAIVQGMIQSFILGKNPQTVKTILSQPVPPPLDRESVVEGYWLEKGDEEPAAEDNYVLTATVRKNMRDVARVLASRHHPVLLEGETSAGKTSLIRHMARLTGNTVVRINNHEHTDLQEYIGSYAADSNQRLVFVEGPLIEAMRKGYWVILDELNLAPPDVLEALNRLLDDNRELFITETNTTVRAHPRFVLLATQNPSGLYGGRKRLSRAFVNRFVQLRFGELPSDELEVILHKRCALPSTYAHRMVAVMHDLQVYRSTAGVFAGKESYMTLRDLFRWGERYKKCSIDTGGRLFDWDQFLADQGFFLLGGRCRRTADEQVVKDVLLKHFKRPVDCERVFGRDSPYLPLSITEEVAGFEHIVWTRNSLRMAVVAGQSWLYDEPVLLVGETGCGKTSMCEVLSAAGGQTLLSINCHLMTEAADFLGRLRPAPLDRQRETGALFEWTEGPLVSSMRRGCPILVDEISLAADSVLERLNSVLEPERQLLLTETADRAETLTAKKGFQLMATMNPGGDYGKKELSKALRNRFTEIWCSADYSKADLLAIIKKNASDGGKLSKNLTLGDVIVEFAEWFSASYSGITRCAFTIRDILAWTHFFNRTRRQLTVMDARFAVVHGACVTLLDSLGATSIGALSAQTVRSASIAHLCSRMGLAVDDFAVELRVATVDRRFGIAPFTVDMGRLTPATPTSYSFQAPTCKENLYRLLRAMSIRKPILMEGSPGAGKSSLVVALAKASGHRLVRLNLSDQTDLSDLFGSDLPTTNANGDQTFAWNDGPLLKAMKQGDWVLLDEMNLASQSVLEGLNACLDHRGAVFLPELGRTFHIGDSGTRFFACQNPFKQGGNRRGLPKSFINRFSVVYTEPMTSHDELAILIEVYAGRVAEEHLHQMVAFNEKLNAAIGSSEFADVSAPWEFNLRDMLRWVDLVAQSRSLHPGAAFDVLYRSRMRTKADREKMTELYSDVFGARPPSDCPSLWLTPKTVRIGSVALNRRALLSTVVDPQRLDARLLRTNLRHLERLATCVHMNWLSIIVGHSAVGKSTLVRSLAALCGQSLNTFHLTSDTDALELLGTFEQLSNETDLNKAKAECADILALIGESADFLETVQSAESLQQLRAVMETAVEACSNADAKPKVQAMIEKLSDSRLRFEWVNSPFLDAFIDGHWLLVENVNCCSAAVLDRLNSALEPNGELTLSEKGAGADGQIATYTAHPNFRVFFTMNPRHGPISRAMRNRAVEICLLDEDSWTSSDQDVCDVTALMGVSDAASAKQLKALFDATLLDGCNVLSPYSLLEGAFVVDDGQVSSALLSPVFGRPIDDVPTKTTLELYLAAPSIVELATKQSGTQLQWLSEAWSMQCVDQSSTLSALLFAILSASASDVTKRTSLILENTQQTLSDDLTTGLINLANSVGSTLHESLSKSRRQMPFDSRFYGFVDLGGASLDTTNQQQITDSVIHLCLHRIFAFLIAQIPTEKESAAYFTDRFLKKRIGESALPSPALKFLADFVAAVREVMTSAEIGGDVALTQATIVGMWDLLLFMRTVNEKLSAQTGTAPAQLAWQMMQSSFLTGHGGFSQLRRAIGLISQEWSVDERAEMNFLEVYKRLTMVRPYSSAEAVDAVAKVWSRVEELNKSNSSELQRQHLWQQLNSGSFADIEPLDAGEANESRVVDRMSSITESALYVARQLTCALVWDKPVGEQLAQYVLRMQSTIPCSLVLAKTVDWAQFGDISLRLSWFNSSECVQSLDTLNDRQLKNIHLLWLPVITEMVTVIWAPLHFEVSLSRLPLSAIGAFARQLQQLAAVVWSAGIDFLNLSSSLRQELWTYARRLIDEAIVGGEKDVLLSHLVKMEEGGNHLFVTMISLGLVLLKQTTPPRRMLDPVVKARERRLLLERKLMMINDQITILNRYFLVTTGTTLETHRDGQMKDHAHPLLRALWTERSAIEERLEDRSLDVIGVRPTLLSFERLTTELASFSAMTDAALGDPIDKRPLKSRADASLQADAAKLYAWSKSAELILKTLTVEFNGYPDITMPYVMALNSTLAGVYGLASALDAEMVCRTKRTELLAPSVTLLDPSAKEWSDEFVKWALHETSPLPNKHQMLVALRALTNGHSLSAIDWLKRTWSVWHTNSVAKREKMFEYRSRAKNADGDPLDDDEIEMLAQFPDFAQAEQEDDQQASFSEPDPNLNSGDLCAVLDVLVGKSTRCPTSYPVAVWLTNALRGAHGLIDADSSHYADHLGKLVELATKTEKTEETSSGAVNVYAENDAARLAHCCELVANLKKASVQLAEQWPEVGALKDIQSACDNVLAMSAASPLMRLAAKLESLLTECANWESVAHRGVSLEPWLAPLRALLVDWRKMEVRCWEALINACDVETQRAALLASYPLIEACDKLLSTETNEVNLTAVLIEWLQNSTIGDLSARLEAVEVCACWVAARGMDPGLAERLRSVRLYFAQFATVVDEKLAALRSPLQKELKEFVKVVKYQDLNLWSVKLSAQKAHQQLFKIVKRYKQVVQEPIRPLVDQLLPIPAHLRQAESVQSVRFDSTSAYSRLKRLSEISAELCNTLNTSAASEALLELTELVATTGKELNTATQYTGTDEEKEKQQGRAHSKRQKAVAKLLRETKACGIAYRKGLKLDAEQQLQTLLTQVRFEHSRDAEAVVRLSAALTTVVIGALEKPNKQVGPQIAVSMRGIAQLVPDILMKTTARVDQLVPAANKMAALSSAISDAVVDARDSAADGRPSDQRIVLSSFDSLCQLFARVDTNLTDWSSLWQCVPDTEDGSKWNELTELLPTDNRLRIADVRRNEAQWSATTDKLNAALAIARQLLTDTKAIRQEGTFAEDVFFWKRSSLQTFADATDGRVGTLLEDIDSLLQLCTSANSAENPFSRPLLAARCDLLEAVAAESRLRESWSDCKRPRKHVDDAVAQSAIDRLLLTTQRLHKAFVEDELVRTTEDVTVWMTKVVDGIAAAGIDQANDASMAFYQSLIDVQSLGELTDDVQAVAEAARNVSRLVRSLVDTVKGTMRDFVRAYHAMAGVFVKIAKDGYVDPIPKADDGAGGKGKEKFEDLQNAGMGEGQGMNDVTDEIEDLGQIEGLKGDNEKEGEQPPPEDANSEQKPIDMDDDFSGQLEDIKLGEDEEENSDSGSDEEEQPQPDWQVGDADDSQEDQLDPNLWDKEEEQNEQPSTDDDNKGAQEKQDELGAKDAERNDEQQNGADSNMEAADEVEAGDDQEGNDENGEEEEPKEEDAMENIDLRDAQMNEDEEDEGDNAANAEEGMQEEGDEEGEDGESEERAEGVPDDENQPEEENTEETDAKVDDTAETSAAAASDTGLGHSEKSEQVASESNHDQSMPNDEQQPMDEQSQGDGDVNRDRTAEANADNATAQRAKETRDSRSNQLPRKRPNTEQREKKTLGDKTEKFERSNVEKMDEKESERPDEGPVKSDLYAHEPNIGAEREEQQVVDAATLEEAKESAVQMDQLDDADAAGDDERNVADDEDQKEPDSAERAAAAISHNEITPAAEIVDAMDNDDGGDQSAAGPARPVSDKSTIHTVLDFYEHATTALDDAQLDAALFSVKDDRNSGDMDVHRRHWNRLSNATHALAAELTENLRLILEPTQASKLEGDYRTGKRLNMRRLIPYVASNFRKDKIWLRRTKKASREYQILIAVDDSSSMADNKTRELTLESVSLLEAALRHLESGRLGVCKFGESIELLHGFDDHFGDEGGAKVVSRLTFQQTKTDICQLLSFGVGYFGRQPTPTGSDVPAQLLVIVSDGRGLFADGMDKARRAVQAVNAARIFVVFVVVDNPEHKDSIVDIKIPVFGPTGVPQILSYMDFFPFPFYVILKRINALPAVIGDALRQWFEIVANRQ